MIQEFSSTQLEKAFGTPARTVARWVDRGIVRPLRGGGGQGAGNAYKFDVNGALCVGAAAALLHRGESVKLVGTLANFLAPLQSELVLADIRAGQSCALIVGGDCRGLWSPAAAYGAIQDKLGIVKLAPELLLAVDLAPLCEVLAKIEPDVPNPAEIAKRMAKARGATAGRQEKDARQKGRREMTRIARMPRLEKATPIDADFVERYKQFSVLAAMLPEAGGRARTIRCGRCGIAGEALTVTVDGRSFPVGVSRLAVANNAGAAVGDFQTSTTDHGDGAISLGTRMTSEPIVRTGSVEIVCSCGHRQRWHCQG